MAGAIVAPTRLTVDPVSGAIQWGDDETIAPLTRYTKLDKTALAAASRITDKRGSFICYTLPRIRVGNAELSAHLELNKWVLRTLWLQPHFDGDTEHVARSRPEAEGVALQEDWLRQHVGVASGRYPWGIVWNRWNINADWFDISISYHQPKSHDVVRGGSP